MKKQLITLMALLVATVSHANDDDRKIILHNVTPNYLRVEFDYQFLIPPNSTCVFTLWAGYEGFNLQPHLGAVSGPEVYLSQEDTFNQGGDKPGPYEVEIWLAIDHLATPDSGTVLLTRKEVRWRAENPVPQAIKDEANVNNVMWGFGTGGAAMACGLMFRFAKAVKNSTGNFS